MCAAPEYPSQIVRFGQTPSNLPDGYAFNQGGRAYTKKFSNGFFKGQASRLRACTGCIMLFFTLISVVIGIAGIALAASAINADTANDKELQAAKIILDALDGWKQPLPTALQVVDGDFGCSNASKPMFVAEWPGIREGCYWGGKINDKCEIYCNQGEENKDGCNKKIEKIDPISQTIFSS